VNYDGSPHGATASWGSTGTDAQGGPLTVSYVGINGTSYASSTTAPTNPGSYMASASFAGDANHTGSSNSQTFTIGSAVGVGLSLRGDVYLLDQTASGALTVSGNAALNVDGTLQVDSSSASAVILSGKASINAGQFLIVGGDQVSGGAHFTDAPTLHDTAANVANPLAALTGPTGGTTYPAVNLSSGTLRINPGVYPSITVSGDAHLILAPGVYVIGSGGVTVSNNATIMGTTDASGQGVLLYNNGVLNVSGNAVVNLTAYSTGIYAGVAIYQAVNNASAITISGNANLNLNGAVLYDANVLSMVTLSGKAQVQAALVVNELTLSGNSDDSAP
jgi:hypothetical protein